MKAAAAQPIDPTDRAAAAARLPSEGPPCAHPTVAQWLFARAMARRGHTEARDALATDGPSPYIKALVGLVRTEAASTPALPPGPGNDQEVLVEEVLDAEILDEEEAA